MDRHIINGNIQYVRKKNNREHSKGKNKRTIEKRKGQITLIFFEIYHCCIDIPIIT